MDNGSEFINYDLVAWCEARNIAMTRARPYKSNDNAHVEQKNGAVVRREAFRYRYGTPAEMGLLNELWHLVNLRKNHLLPTVSAMRSAEEHDVDWDCNWLEPGTYVVSNSGRDTATKVRVRVTVDDETVTAEAAEVGHLGEIVLCSRGR